MNRRVFILFALSAVMLTVGTSSTLARHQSSPAHDASLALQGTINASETHLFSNPDVGAAYQWSGQGTVAPLGTVTGSGTNHGVGFIAKGTPTGTMTLSTSTGSIDLSVTYDQTPGFAPLPVNGTYVITGGTGAYVGARGSGLLVRRQGPCPDESSDGLCPASAAFPMTYQFSGGSGAAITTQLGRAVVLGLTHGR
jgi:hypothetical protein